MPTSAVQGATAARDQQENPYMTKLLVAGGTGLVGKALIELALADPRVTHVVAPTRHALAPHPRLDNPVLQDFENMDRQASWWRVDAVACALGTTLRQAGSRSAFRRVDLEYPVRIARIAHQNGASTFVLTSASGASTRSPFFYSRTKAELEAALCRIGYASLSFVRPGLLIGDRPRRRRGEHFAGRVLGALAPLMPPRYRPVPAHAVARELLAAALAARPGIHIVESESIPGQ